MKRLAFILDSDGTSVVIKLNKTKWNEGKFAYGNTIYNIRPPAVSKLTKGLKGIGIFYIKDNPEPISANQNMSAIWKAAINSKVVFDILGQHKTDILTVIIYVAMSLLIGLLTGYIIGHDLMQTQGYRVVQLK